MKSKFTIQEMTTIALFAALLSVSSYISIRLPFSSVPITAQTMVVNLIALLLKPKKAGITILIWILLGCVGLPVFSNGTGGLGVIAGPTGGYIIGALAAAVLISLLRSRKNNFIQNLSVVVVIDFTVIYAFGIPWMKFSTDITWETAFVTGLLPFVLGDLIKDLASVLIAKPLYRTLNSIQYNFANSRIK